MKILYLVHEFYPYYFTGTEKFVFHMATCMRKQGHQVTVATFAFKENLKNSQRDGNLLTERYMYNGIPVISFGYKEASDDVHYRVNNEDLQRFAGRLLSEEKPDVIHAGHLMRVFDILKVARACSIPYIITLTDFWAICFNKGILINKKLNLCTGPKRGEACAEHCPDLPREVIAARLEETRSILRDSRAVCSPTRFLANIYLNEMPDLNMKMIPLGLRMGKSVFEQKDLSKGDPVKFMFGGTWLPHKGLHLLLEVFEKVKGERLTLKVYGSGPSKEYNDLIDESARKDKRIQIQGVFGEADLEKIFRDADCSVIPSLWWENSPYMLTESLARNVPMIVTDVDGLTEYVQDGVNGFSFRLGDSSHLQEVMERIVNDPSILKVMRENLSRLVMQTVEEEAYAYEKLMRSVCR